MNKPSLIEANTKSYLYSKLKSCHEYKSNIMSWILNTTLFILFFITLGIILYYSRKDGLTPYERQEKMIKEQEYIVSKIRDYKEMNKNTSSITNLPIVNESKY